MAHGAMNSMDDWVDENNVAVNGPNGGRTCSQLQGSSYCWHLFY